jgi:hypothetical protein
MWKQELVSKSLKKLPFERLSMKCEDNIGMGLLRKQGVRR